MATAKFLGRDTVTMGYWLSGQTKRGKSGYYFISNATTYTSFPSYVSSLVLTPSYSYYTGGSTNAALEIPGGGTKGSSFWYAVSGNNLTATITATDSAPHILSMFFYDQTGNNRKQIVTLKDTGGTTLSSYNMSVYFNSGNWLSWLVTGTIVVSIDKTAGYNPVVSGFFWDEPVNGASGPTSKFVQTSYAF